MDRSKDDEVEIYDISQTLREGMDVWPGDPQLRQRWVQRTERGESSNLSAIDMGIHTGTHIDAPLHLSDSGSDIASIPVHYFIGPVRVFPISAKERIAAADLSLLDWGGVRRVLFKTRAGSLPDYPPEGNFVYLDEDAAEFLVRQSVLLVGTDVPSVDAFESTRNPSGNPGFQPKFCVT
jgi:arylformamidase